MGLRIATNVASQTAVKNLRFSGAEQSNEFAKLSSGKRINQSADDAAGLAIAKKLEAETRGMRQANRNANDGISMVQVAEGALNESGNILTRLRELTVQAASDTIGEKERGFLDLEYQQLVQEADRIAQSSTYAGIPVVKGETGAGTMEFHVGAYAGENNKVTYEADYVDATASTLEIDGTGISTRDDANDSMEYIDNAIEMVAGYRASLGSIQSRLQSSVRNLEIAAVNQDAARSRIEDVDYAESASKVASINVMKDAGISTLAQANNIPNSALRLL
ncbi:MAG: flagellin FliC [Bacteriovoracaceae bacterium]|nr:flagellin FliC [Bacteriovoracaceae bacterium]